jgi:hypothetical protein
VTGSAGAVEGNSRVTIRNNARAIEQLVSAASSGSFTATIAASLGDPISMSAQDAAGNIGPSATVNAGPSPATVVLTIADGAGQVGVMGRPLVDPLLVRLTALGQPVQGLRVRFLNDSPDGSLSASEVLSDGSGSARVRYTLGGSIAEKRVRAVVLDGGLNHEGTFQLEAVGPPMIHRLDPDAAVPGETLTIEGENFSSIAQHNVVQIGGNAATVTTAARTSIQAVVPENLPGPDAQVVVSLTGVASTASLLRILVLPVPMPPVGVPSDVVEIPTGIGIFPELPFSTGQEAYLLMFESTAESSTSFTLDIQADTPVSLSRFTWYPDQGRPEITPADREGRIRKFGYEILGRYGLAPKGKKLRGAQAPSERDFWVVDIVASQFVLRRGILEHEGAHSLFYVDNAVSQDVLSTEDVRALGERFESEVYNQIRSVYGTESDIDGNGKVIVLLTPIVNLDATTGGRTFGFFFQGDLASGPFSNRGEIFYMIVPDPSGLFGLPTGSKDAMIETIAGVTAHEFVHMIDANERIILRGLGPQVPWLEEGLAHHGEFVVGLPLLALGNILAYLEATSSEVSLFGSASSLSTRGYSTLLVRRLVERFQSGVIRNLVIGSGIGVDTVEAASGEPFDGTYHDLSLALYNEMFPVPNLGTSFSSIQLRDLFEIVFGSPEDENALGLWGGFVQRLPGNVIPMRRGSTAYLIVQSEKRLVVANLSFQAPGSTDLQVAVVRIQ